MHFAAVLSVVLLCSFGSVGVAGAQEAPLAAEPIVPAPYVAAIPPIPAVPPASLPQAATLSVPPASAAFPDDDANTFGPLPDALPSPAHARRIWHIVASAAYTLITDGDATPHGIITAGFAVAPATKGFAGRSSALHIGFGARGYLLTPHEAENSFFSGCGSGIDRNVRRTGYGPLGQMFLAARFIESTLSVGALYLNGSFPGCMPGAPRVSESGWALALGLSLAAAVDTANTFMIRAEFLSYLGDETVRSISLGVEVHL